MFFFSFSRWSKPPGSLQMTGDTLLHVLATLGSQGTRRRVKQLMRAPSHVKAIKREPWMSAVPVEHSSKGNLIRQLEKKLWGHKASLPGSTFTHVTSTRSALRQIQREHLKGCQSRTPLLLSLLHRPWDTVHLTDGPCASCFIYLTGGFLFKTGFEQEQKNPHVCHNPSTGRHLKSETLFVEWQLRYDTMIWWVTETFGWWCCWHIWLLKRPTFVRLRNLLFYCHIAPVGFSWLLPST